MEFDSWRMHSDLNRVTEDLRSATERIADISEKVGYDTVKLGRIEKHLGIKPKRGLHQVFHAVGADRLHNVWTDCLQEHGRDPPQSKKQNLLATQFTIRRKLA